MKNSNLMKKKYKANMGNLIAKKVSSASIPKIIAIEGYVTKKLNMSTLGEIVGERYRYDGFS